MTKHRCYEQLRQADKMLTIAIQNDEPDDRITYLRERLYHAREMWQLHEELPKQITEAL